MIEFDDLRCFVEVVESGGFSRAATRLRISRSIVSRRIAKIESEFGTRLLDRTTRQVSPTEAGWELKARSDRILAEYEGAREAIADQTGMVAGRLRISAPVVYGVRHVAPVMANFARKYPLLEIEVVFDDRFVDILGERFDVAIRVGRLEDSSLVARRIAPIRSVYVASPDYLARRGLPSTPDDLAGHECLIYTGTTRPDWLFRYRSRLISVRPAGRLLASSGEAVLEWAIAGLGIANLPSFMVSEAIRTGRLTLLLEQYEADELGAYVIRPPGQHVPRKVRALIDTLLEAPELASHTISKTG